MGSLKLLAALFVLAIFSICQGKFSFFARILKLYMKFYEFQYLEVKMKSDWSAICSEATTNSSGPCKT